MLSNHFRRILYGVACLLVGTGLRQDMGGQYIANIVRPMGKQSLDRTAPGPRIVEAIVTGNHPTALTVETLVKRTSLPLSWDLQRSLLGFQ